MFVKFIADFGFDFVQGLFARLVTLADLQDFKSCFRFHDVGHLAAIEGKNFFRDLGVELRALENAELALLRRRGAVRIALGQCSKIVAIIQ